MRSCLNRDWLVPRVVTSVQGRGLWLCTSRHRARRVPRSPRRRGPPVTPAVPVRFHTSQGPAVPCRREASAAARPRAGQGTPELTRLHYKWKRPQTRCRDPPRLTDEPRYTGLSPVTLFTSNFPQKSAPLGPQRTQARTNVANEAQGGTGTPAGGQGFEGVCLASGLNVTTPRSRPLPHAQGRRCPGLAAVLLVPRSPPPRSSSPCHWHSSKSKRRSSLGITALLCVCPRRR